MWLLWKHYGGLNASKTAIMGRFLAQLWVTNEQTLKYSSEGNIIHKELQGNLKILRVWIIPGLLESLTLDLQLCQSQGFESMRQM